MKKVIKRQYRETWFALPKTLVHSYLPTIGIRAFVIYAILACYQDEKGRVKRPLFVLKYKTDMRHMKILLTLDYLHRLRLIDDYLENHVQTVELGIKPESKIPKKRTNDND